MITSLIRQDASFRRLPFWVLMSSVWAGVASAMIAWMTIKRGPVEMDMLAGLVWFGVLLYLVFGEVGTRAHRFTLALPITVGNLWMAHVVAVIITGVAVLAVSGGVAAGTMVLTGRLVEGGDTAPGALVLLGGLLTGSLLLAIGVVHAFRPAAHDVPFSPGRVTWSLATAVLTFVLALALRPLGVFGVALVIAAAAAVFFYLSRNLPAVLSIPANKRHAVEHVVSEGPEAWQRTESSPGLWFMLRLIHRVTTCAKKQYALWIVAPFLLFIGFWTSGIDAYWNGTSQRFAYPFMVVYVLMAATAPPLSGLGALDWLPITRRRALALVTVPLFLLVLVGYLSGAVTWSFLDDHETLCVVQDRKTGDSKLCVVTSACEIAWDGHVPDIETPSGKTFTPWNGPLVKGLPIRVYFPYDAPPGSSDEFIATQVSRAAHAMFGVDIPPAEIRSRYFPAGDDTRSLSLEADYPGLKRTDRIPYFPFTMMVVVGFWALLTAGYAGWLRGDVSEKKRKIMMAVFIAIPMAFWVGDFLLEVTQFSRIDPRNAFITSVLRDVGSTLAGTVAFWVACGLIAWFTYRLAERSLDRAELPPKLSTASDNA